MVIANAEFEKACKVLGLDTRHASVNNINKAYRALAKKYHPDKNPGIDPALFVRITDAKDTALKHAHDHTSASAPHAKPLKLEIVPGEMEFTNVGRRETKSREFIVYSTGGPFTRFSIDRKHLPKWMHISSITRTTGEELPARVTVRVTGPETGSLHEWHIPVRIENKNNGQSVEARVGIKLNMKGPNLQLGCKSFEFPADRHGMPGPQVLTLTNAGAGQIKGDLQSPEQWIIIEPAHVSFHDRQLVKIRVDASKLAGRSSGQINVRTNAGEGIVTVHAAGVASGAKTRVPGQVHGAGMTNAYREPASAGASSKGWKAPGSAAPPGVNAAKPRRQPLQKSRAWKVVKVDSRKAALGVTAAVSSLFLFSIIGIASTLPPANQPSEPPQQTAQSEQPGKIQDAAAVIPRPAVQREAPAVQAETPAVNEAQRISIQPGANGITGGGRIAWQVPVNHYWSASAASSDNTVGNLTSSTVTPVTTGESNSIKQDNATTTTPGKTDAGPGPDNKVKKKDGKMRPPLQYVDIEGPRNRFNQAKNQGPPRIDKNRDH